MSPDLLVIIPTRGRPATVAELNTAFASTCTAESTLTLVVDADDPTINAYIDAMADTHERVDLHINDGGRTMVAALNGAVAALLDGETRAVAFMGDDHRPRTPGWDRRYLAALNDLGTGIVYGDDLLQGERIPTQVAMTADIPRALGHMAPPTLTHLFVDNYWRDLGRGAGRLRYLPDVIVEHLHPIAGKAEWDEGHKRVNEQAMYERDHAAYNAYAQAHLLVDITIVKGLL